MLDGTYSVTADTPMGRHSGTVTLTTSPDGTISATLSVGSMSLQAHGTYYEDSFNLEGSARVVIFNMKYDIKGQVVGDSLSATCVTSKGTFEVSGERTC